MTDNFDSNNKKLTPYKEIVKKGVRVLLRE